MYHIYIILAILSVFFLGCGGESSSSGNTQENHEITVTTAYHVENLGNANSLNVKLNLVDGAKDVYVLLTNGDSAQAAQATISHNSKLDKVVDKNTTINLSNNLLDIRHSALDIQNSNRDMLSFLQKNKKVASEETDVSEINIARNPRVPVGTSKAFFLDIGTSNSTTATLRKSIVNVNTLYGAKTLNIWVSNDSFGGGCSKLKCVNQNMVDALATSFLKQGSDNDIYDWVSNIFGNEWANDANEKSDSFILSNNEISILLTDIDGDNRSNGGVIGFFWAKDNVKKSSISGSNEQLMFYIDSVVFANGTGSWNIDDFWPKEIISTLAHEFQHMIHFYQKTVKQGANSDVWLNEMLSEAAEDLIATKIRHIGSRGVAPDIGSAGDRGNTSGRYPLFNINMHSSLTNWSSVSSDYSKVNAFGAFLTRNYGGASVLHDIMHNNFSHEDAVTHATGKDFSAILRDWGTAVLLSDKDNLVGLPAYNRGDFSYMDYGNSTYALGSINFFNYNPQPRTYTDVGEILPHSNYYYKVGNNLTGSIDISLKLNGTTSATLIVK